MGSLNSSSLLIKKLALLQKYANKAYVTPNSISTSKCCIMMDNISDCEFSIHTKDLCELAKTGCEFEIEEEFIIYKDNLSVGRYSGTLYKKIPLLDTKYHFNFGLSTCTLKIPRFESISTDKTLMTYTNNKLVLETNEYTKTRLSLNVDRVEGVDFFQINVKGADLKILNEMVNEKILSFFGEYLVVFEIEELITTAVVLKSVA